MNGFIHEIGTGRTGLYHISESAPLEKIEKRLGDQTLPLGLGSEVL
jgi:hypothetical protein